MKTDWASSSKADYSEQAIDCSSEGASDMLYFNSLAERRHRTRPRSVFIPESNTVRVTSKERRQAIQNIGDPLAAFKNQDLR